MLSNLFSLFQNENVCAWAGSYKFLSTGVTVTDIQTCYFVQEPSPSLSLHTGAQGGHLGLVSVFPAAIFLGRGAPQRVLVHGLLVLGTEPSSLLSRPTFSPEQERLYLCFGECSGAGTWNAALICNGLMKGSEVKSK